MGVGMFAGDSDAFLYFRLNKWAQYVKSASSPAGSPAGKGPLDATAASVSPTMEVLRWASAACECGSRSQRMRVQLRLCLY
jgi:hypothetical protein